MSKAYTKALVSLVDCSKAGWLLKNKGVWSITDTGRKAYNDYPDPEKFYREAIRLYQAWKLSTPSAEEVESLEELSPAATAKATGVTYEEAEEQAWNEIETHASV